MIGLVFLNKVKFKRIKGTNEQNQLTLEYFKININ